ncbi:hypothetical protein HanHA89_Chr08g0308201 [Helianthus annuus]|nr:hypothetical protein HanHA89_Chr08g0308201 [Helianthus annuus]
MVVEERYVDPSYVCDDNQISDAEVDEKVKEDSLHPTTKVKTNDAQETTVGHRVCADNQSSAAEVVTLRTNEVDKKVKEDSLNPTIEVKTNYAQETTVGDPVVNKQIEKESKMLHSLKILMTFVILNSGSEDVDQSIVCPYVENTVEVEDEINVYAKNFEKQAKVGKLNEKQGS